MSDFRLTGFGLDKVNGTYTQTSTYNGKPLYTHDTNTEITIEYHDIFLPFSNEPTYLIIEKTQFVPGAIPVQTPKYRTSDTSVTDTTVWTSMRPVTSSEEATGTEDVDPAFESSSSSESDSSSSSSSSS
jgi:hypothetical protein